MLVKDTKTFAEISKAFAGVIYKTEILSLGDAGANCIATAIQARGIQIATIFDDFF